ncbi:MAG TPA: phage baseplate assembly protein V [Solirubrobacteraceae bacterium]|nr:phage baseplate assembly protein V [Solirubrobacteraceae bacterium]
MSDYFGKYRGKVLSTEDPTVSGKLLCAVAALPGMDLNWATPCVPYAGEGQGLFALPEEGANVWVEFEGGDPEKPIWSGGCWEPGLEPVMPELSPEAPELVNILSSKFCTLALNDTPAVGGLSLTAEGPVAELPVKLRLDSLGFSVTVGELQLTMNPETGITLKAGEATVVLSVEGLVCEAPDIEMTAEGGIDMTAPTEITGDVNIVGPVEIEGPTSISEVAEIGGALTVAGDASVEGESNLAGAVTVEGEANFTGAVTIEGEANVAGALTAEGETNVAGALTVEGDAAVAGLIEGIVVPPAL